VVGLAWKMPARRILGEIVWPCGLAIVLERIATANNQHGNRVLHDRRLAVLDGRPKAA
jgi:hypothetical protein